LTSALIPLAFLNFGLKFLNDNFDNFDNRMVRPCKADTTYFQRRLDFAQRSIIRAAGAGDLTRGFDAMIDIYTRLHAMGYRPGMPLDCIGLINNEPLI
jgi:hypothetical protein